MIEKNRDSIINLLEENIFLEKKCSFICEDDNFKLINKKCICFDGSEYDLE